MKLSKPAPERQRAKIPVSVRTLAALRSTTGSTPAEETARRFKFELNVANPSFIVQYPAFNRKGKQQVFLPCFRHFLV